MGKKSARRPRQGAVSLFFLVLSLVALSDPVRTDQIVFPGEKASRLCFSLNVAARAKEADEEENRLIAFGVLPVNAAPSESFEGVKLVPGGELFGVRMEIDGLLVAGTGPVAGTDTNPAAEAGIAIGDRLISADGVELRGSSTLTKIMAKTGGKEVKITVERNGERRETLLTPVRDEDGVYRAGLWVREAAAGIGTVTFTDPETGLFAGLGHGICDGETGETLPLLKGTVCQAAPENVRAATTAEPGEIQGKLEDGSIGKLQANTDTGIYGTEYEPGELSQGEAIPIALKKEVKTGKATILCQLDGEGKKEYEALIEEVCDKNGETKNFVIRVTDEALLQKAGGIVQGMSGSPILQNGKLIGAVTHVMLRDPTRGYGIFIENMLKTARETEREEKAA